MASTADRTGQDGLSERLRAVSRGDHDPSPNPPYLDALLAGRLPRAAYAAYTAQHFFVYETLERAAVAMRDDPVAGVFVFPQLSRLPALLADLEFLLGPDWADRLVATPATVAYCDRLHEVAFTSPVDFVAHHYTRHLQDLAASGRIGAAVRRTYGLTDDGCRFFAYDDVQPGAFERRYRGLLDALSLPEEGQQRLLGEVGRAYRLTAAVLADLDRHRAG